CGAGDDASSPEEVLTPFATWLGGWLRPRLRQQGRRPVEEPQRASLITGADRRRGRSHGCEASVAEMRDDALTGCEVPDLECSVLGCRHHAAGIGGDGAARDALGVALQRGDEITRRDVPDLERSVFARRDYALA